MNIVSSGDVLHHHHHPLNISVGGTDEEGDLDAVSPDEDGRTRRRPTRGQSRIEFERLAAFFHVPINEAAKGLGVCATVLKKVCRKHGIPRWPHRKIKKLDTMLAMLETAANKPGNPQHDDDVRKKIDAVMRDREVLMTEGKLVGEGKSDHRRKVENGKGRESARKRKKPDEDDDDDAENESESLHDPNNNIYSHHAHNGNNEQDIQGQMLMPMGMGHMTTVDMSSMSYPPYGYTTSGYLGGYASGGMSINSATGIMGGNGYAYNPMYWSAMNNNVSLPGISSGVISTNGMMMNNLPHHNNMALTPTPISPMTPNLSTLSASSPLPISASHKHQKLSHSDVLLDPHHPHYSPYPSHRPHPHLAYSDFSVQQESPTDPSAHFRLFNEMQTMHSSATE